MGWCWFQRRLALLPTPALGTCFALRSPAESELRAGWCRLLKGSPCPASPVRP